MFWQQKKKGTENHKEMADVLKIYLSECARRHLEPHYAFFAHLEEGAIDVDVDFIPLDTLRVFLHALQASSSDLPASLAGFSSNNKAKGGSLTKLRTKQPTPLVQVRLDGKGSQGMYLSVFSVIRCQ